MGAFPLPSAYVPNQRFLSGQADEPPVLLSGIASDASVRLGWTRAETDSNDSALTTAQDRHGGGLSRQLLAHETDDIIRTTHDAAVDGHDHVAAASNGLSVEGLLPGSAAQAGAVGRASLSGGGDDRSAGDLEAEVPGERGGESLCCHAHVRIDDMADRDELAHRALGRVNRDREADSLGRAGVAPDLGVDPDHASAGVEKRPAR